MRRRLPFVLLSLLAVPAQAQMGTGPRIAPDTGRARTAQIAEGVEDPATLLRLADAALGARRIYQAADLLERAESRLLTRSELASEADRPAVGGAIGDLAAARDALARRDTAGAQLLVAAALQRLDRGEAPSAQAAPGASTAGSGLGPAPAWGGGGPPIKTQPLPPGGLPAMKPPAR
jgi:hypothetical protein